MQDEIKFAADPVVVGTSMDEQFDAFFERLDALRATSLSHETISNEQWQQLFGLYWGLRELMAPTLWSKWWKRVGAYIDSGASDNYVLSGWAWFTRAMNWRRAKARTAGGREARRWETLKRSPRKHAAHKARNRDAQRRRRRRDRQREAAE